MKLIVKRTLTLACTAGFIFTLAACSSPEEKMMSDMESALAKVEKQVSEGQICVSEADQKMEAFGSKLESIANKAEAKGVDPDNFTPEQEKRLEEIAGRMMRVSMQFATSLDTSC
ncbi:hypothetical protein CWE15_08050 [Aliidiomarina taiwanensis]|uniref:Lipoprotein n=1 Tax=Aliidiomarina taiwanensis TaxID=946228 RepID=A0A432X1F1_9GAMM|nr:hypothetical protein [Aliidiomarina taiwanensis]RUO40088.1 hypothetical protein CWE15_08050 [Aliidiomarina taiwanensis]